MPVRTRDATEARRSFDSARFARSAQDDSALMRPCLVPRASCLRPWCLTDPQHLVRLETQPPARMGETVFERELGVPRHVGAVHGLEKEVREGQVRVAIGFATDLRKHELELVARSQNEIGICLWA